MRVSCPGCGQSAVVTSSRQITDTLRQGYALCKNEACGWAGVVHVAIASTITPSRLEAMPSSRPTAQREAAHVSAA